MNVVARLRVSVMLVGIGLIATGCVQAPSYRAELPQTITSDNETIAIIGDLQHTSWYVRFLRRREDNRPEQQVLLADLAAHKDELSSLVIVGDLVYAARSRSDWADFDRLIAPYIDAIPVLPALGNHDYPCIFIQVCNTTKLAKGIRQRFPWFEPGVPYAVVANDLLLLFLDSESHLQEQGAWLEQQLADASGRYAAALIFFHRPPFTNSIDFGAKPNLEVQEFVVPRLEAAQLPVVVFNGHVHGLEYIVKNGVHYVTTAGGGGPRGAMADERPLDFYSGPDCPQPGKDYDFRPLNYSLLHREADRLVVDIRGFCRGDAGVSMLDRIEVPL